MILPLLWHRIIPANFDGIRLCGKCCGTGRWKVQNRREKVCPQKRKKPWFTRLFSVVGLVGLEPMSTIRNRVPPSLSLFGTLCSLGFRLAVSPTGCARLRSPHDRGDHWFSAPQTAQKNHPQRVVSLVGLVGLEPMTPTMSTWCSNQLSYNPTGHNGMIIAHLIYKCNR